jgi:hypothetical protein
MTRYIFHNNGNGKLIFLTNLLYSGGEKFVFENVIVLITALIKKFSAFKEPESTFIIYNNPILIQSTFTFY